MVQTGTAREAERTTRSIPHTNPGSERQSRDLTTGGQLWRRRKVPFEPLSFARAVRVIREKKQKQNSVHLYERRS